MPVSNLPPRLMRSSTSTYDATPPSGSSAHLTRPSSTGSLQSSVLIQTEPFTSPVKQSLHVNQNKSGISLIRFPSQQQMVQVKTQPPSGGKLRCKCAFVYTCMSVAVKIVCACVCVCVCVFGR